MCILARLSILLICAGILAGVLAWRSARGDPVVRRSTVALPAWPAGAPSITVALLSDIHIGNAAMDAGRLDRIVDQVNALRPDLVLLAGDFIAGHDDTRAAQAAPQLVAPIARLNPRLGTIAVLGNHDWWTGPQDVRRALRRAGVTVLDNQSVRRGPLAIGGVGDRMTRHDRAVTTVAAMRGLGGAPVVLTHSPDLVRALPRSGVPLLLAGHTHCGQAVAFGRALGREPYLRRYRCGIVRDGGRATIVTGGLGASVPPLRIGAPPDLWLLTLRGRN